MVLAAEIAKTLNSPQQIISWSIHSFFGKSKGYNRLAASPSDTFARTEVKPEIALVPAAVNRGIGAPHSPLPAKSLTFIAGTTYARRIRTDGLENVLCGLPRDFHRQFAIIRRRGLLLPQPAGVDRVFGRKRLWRGRVSRLVLCPDCNDDQGRRKKQDECIFHFAVAFAAARTPTFCSSGEASIPLFREASLYFQVQPASRPSNELALRLLPPVPRLHG